MSSERCFWSVARSFWVSRRDRAHGDVDVVVVDDAAGLEGRLDDDGTGFGEAGDVDGGAGDDADEQRASDLHLHGDAEDGVVVHAVELHEQLVVETQLDERHLPTDGVGAVLARVLVGLVHRHARLDVLRRPHRLETRRDLRGAEHHEGDVLLLAATTATELHVAEERVALGGVHVNLRVRERRQTDSFAGTATGTVLGSAVLRIALLSARHSLSEDGHIELDGGTGGAEQTDVAVDGAGLAVAEDEVGADAQRVGAHLVAQTLPPAVARLDVHQRAVQFPDELDGARGDDAVDGVAETVGELP